MGEGDVIMTPRAFIPRPTPDPALEAPFNSAAPADPLAALLFTLVAAYWQG